MLLPVRVLYFKHAKVKILLLWCWSGMRYWHVSHRRVATSSIRELAAHQAVNKYGGTHSSRISLRGDWCRGIGIDAEINVDESRVSSPGTEESRNASVYSLQNKVRNQRIEPRRQAPQT